MMQNRSLLLTLIGLIFCLLMTFASGSAVAAEDEGVAPPLPESGTQTNGGTNSFFTHVISNKRTKIAIRVEYPDEQRARYLDNQGNYSAPIVVEIPGGHNPGGLSGTNAPPSKFVQSGMIYIQFLFPGGKSPDISSEGIYDYRGPQCQQALAEVLRYAAGSSQDAEGQKITERISFARSDIVGAVGLSNGGNLLLKTIEENPAVSQVLAWIATWESPLGEQYVTLELGKYVKEGERPEQSRQPLPNPYYIAGTCQLAFCPWRRMEGDQSKLFFDADAERIIEDPAHQENDRKIRGVFCLDTKPTNRNCDPEEFEFEGLGGPDPNSSKPLLYYSQKLISLIEEKFFGQSKDWPDWLATPEQAKEYWEARVGVRGIQKLPELPSPPPIIMLATSEDHAQVTRDHPHVLVPLKSLIDADYSAVSFVRGNPDAVYLAGLVGSEVLSDDLPELAAGEAWAWNRQTQRIEPRLLPNNLPDGRLGPSLIVTAAALELSDRTWKGRQELGGNFFAEPNLNEPLYPVELNFPFDKKR